MAAAAATPLPADQVELDPKLSLAMEDDDIDIATTPASDLVSHGLGGTIMALNLCPEAGQSGKRSKMIHKKGVLDVDGLPLKIKWNVDYKGGAVVNFRAVTLKDGGVAAVASDGEVAAASSSSSSGEAGAGASDAAPAAGRKRARKEADPSTIDVKKHLALAVEGLKHKGRDAEAEQLQKLVAELE